MAVTCQLGASAAARLFVALRNTCNTLLQIHKKLNINTLTTDNILSVTKYCQWFLVFRSSQGLRHEILRYNMSREKVATCQRGTSAAALLARADMPG